MQWVGTRQVGVQQGGLGQGKWHVAGLVEMRWVGFRLELVLGDGTRVVCFFLETLVLSVLSLFYI